MRSRILENITHINHFTMYNFGRKRNEVVAWFNYLLLFLQTDHGGTKYFVQYCNRVGDRANYLSLEHTIKLSNAI